MILPVLVLTARPTMEIAQVMAGTMVSELDKQYVVSARALGQTWRGVRWRHVFRNVLSTMIVSMSRSFRLLVGELILVEFLFSWPGLGRLLARTLTPSQLTNAAGPLFLNASLIAGTITLLTALFLLSEFASNILMHYFDPRLTLEEAAPNG
jgi:peptide/nickel transport system permease protein